MILRQGCAKYYANPVTGSRRRKHSSTPGGTDLYWHSPLIPGCPLKQASRAKATQEEMFDGLARNPPPQFRAEGGRVAIRVDPTGEKGVKNISEHLAETVVGPDRLR